MTKCGGRRRAATGMWFALRRGCGDGVLPLFLRDTQRRDHAHVVSNRPGEPAVIPGGEPRGAAIAGKARRLPQRHRRRNTGGEGHAAKQPCAEHASVPAENHRQSNTASQHDGQRREPCAEPNPSPRADRIHDRQAQRESAGYQRGDTPCETGESPASPGGQHQRSGKQGHGGEKGRHACADVTVLPFPARARLRPAGGIVAVMTVATGDGLGFRRDGLFCFSAILVRK